jgi:Tol biopolymer transport system component
MSDTPSPLPDRLIAALADRYRIVRELGAGGMATVYLAEDVKHSRQVAVKVLQPDLAAVIGAERFLSEIRTTANLSHPHILPLHDSGEADTFLFYVMPYVEGESLRDLLDREHQLPVDQALAIAKKVGSALQYAHEQGVIHRDVKPGNILLSRGEPRVADFGIALAVSEAGSGRITETGLSLGTPHYMSPEQATGERHLDARSDIYALACILFEMLAGRPPHSGGSIQSVLAQILTARAPDVTTIRPTVPANVGAALSKALERLPADRFATMDDFLVALDDPGFRYEVTDAGAGAAVSAGTAGGATAGGAMAAGGGGPGSRGLLAVLGALVVALAGVAAAGWIRGGAEAPAPMTIVRFTQPDTMRKRQRPNPSMAISSDGRAIVYIGPAERGSLLFYHRLDQLNPRPLPGTEGAFHPTFSPDGTRIAFVSGNPGALRIVDLAGGQTVTLRQDSTWAYGLSWSDDGYIYTADETSIHRLPAQGGARELVSAPAPGSGESWHSWPIAIPGERYLFVTAYGGSLVDTFFGVKDMVTGEFRRVSNGMHPRWMEGDRVAFIRADGAVVVAGIDVAEARLTTTPVVMFDDVAINAGQAYGEMDISPSGTVIYQSGEAAKEELLWVDRSDRATPVDSLFEGIIQGLAISDDGSSLAAGAETESVTDIYVREVRSGPVRRVTFTASPAFRPAWIPGTRRVSYIQNPTQTVDVNNGGVVVSTNANGSGEVETLLQIQDPVQEVAWSPDGRFMLYRVGPSTIYPNRDVLAVDMENPGDTLRLLTTDFDEHSPAVSPDGRWIAYVSTEQGGEGVYVRPFPNVEDGKWLVSTDGGHGPVWNPSADELFYRSSRDQLMSVSYTTEPTFAVRSVSTLFSVAAYADDPFHAGFDVHPDGDRFLFSRGKRQSGELILIQNWLTAVDQRLAEQTAR